MVHKLTVDAFFKGPWKEGLFDVHCYLCCCTWMFQPCALAQIHEKLGNPGCSKPMACCAGCCGLGGAQLLWYGQLTHHLAEPTPCAQIKEWWCYSCYLHQVYKDLGCTKSPKQMIMTSLKQQADVTPQPEVEEHDHSKKSLEELMDEKKARRRARVEKAKGFLNIPIGLISSDQAWLNSQKKRPTPGYTLEAFIRQKLLPFEVYPAIRDDEVNETTHMSREFSKRGNSGRMSKIDSEKGGKGVFRSTLAIFGTTSSAQTRASVNNELILRSSVPPGAICKAVIDDPNDLDIEVLAMDDDDCKFVLIFKGMMLFPPWASKAAIEAQAKAETQQSSSSSPATQHFGIRYEHRMLVVKEGSNSVRVRTEGFSIERDPDKARGADPDSVTDSWLRTDIVKETLEQEVLLTLRQWLSSEK